MTNTIAYTILSLATTAVFVGWFLVMVNNRVEVNGFEEVK